MLPDGCLIHKGRKDFRVKVRGYGVEIGDLEKALLSHAAGHRSGITAYAEGPPPTATRDCKPAAMLRSRLAPDQQPQP